MRSTKTSFPDAIRLQGVPRVSSYEGGPRPPEDDCLPACLQSFLEFQKDPLGLGSTTPEGDPWHDVHVHLVALTGSMFRLGWSPKFEFKALNYLAAVPDPAERIERTLAHIGYPGRVRFSPELAAEQGLQADPEWNEDSVREEIVRYLAERNLPVIAYGLGGPPEPCVVTGYEAGGAVLFGWSMFTEDAVQSGKATREPSGEFRIENWFPTCGGLILPGLRADRPTWLDLDREVVRLAVRVLNMPGRNGLPCGLAASTAWAECLLRNEEFDALTPEALRDRHAVHWCAAGTLAECRAWGSWYLAQAAGRNPDVALLLRDAATCMDNVHDLVWAIWEFTGGFPLQEQESSRLGQAHVRGRIVPLIRMVREQDERALGLLEQALVRWGECGTVGHALENPPKVGYGVRGNPLMGCLEAVLQRAGDAVDYDDLMAVSGGAFRRFWSPDDGGNVDIQYLHPEPLRRVSDLVKRELRTVPADREVALDAFRRSLRHGRPAVAFGVVGPPEGSLVTGVSADGSSIDVCSYFGPESPYPLPQANWFERRDPHGPVFAVTVGDRDRWHEPSLQATVRPTLQYALELAHGPSPVKDHASGLAALRAWREALAEGSSYDTDDPAMLETRGMVHMDQVCMTWERASAAAYLRRAADLEPTMAEPLLAAAELYAKIGEASAQLYPWEMRAHVETGRELCDPATRAQIASTLEQIERWEVEALEHLARALAL